MGSFVSSSVALPMFYDANASRTTHESEHFHLPDDGSDLPDDPLESDDWTHDGLLSDYDGSHSSLSDEHSGCFAIIGHATTSELLVNSVKVGPLQNASTVTGGAIAVEAMAEHGLLPQPDPAVDFKSQAASVDTIAETACVLKDSSSQAQYAKDSRSQSQNLHSLVAQRESEYIGLVDKLRTTTDGNSYQGVLD